MPTAADFVHLHVHSEFSLLDGANRIGPLVEQVKALGMQAVALTDHGVMFGVLEFYRKAKDAGVKPIIGCELYLTPHSRHDRVHQAENDRSHLLLLAENHRGYLNLAKLSSLGHTEGFYRKPRIDFEVLERHKEGLIATTGCLASLVCQALLDGRIEKAHHEAARFVDIFGRDRFFVELQDHGLSEQKRITGDLLEIARKFGLRTIASNDAHYLTRADAATHDMLLCVQTGRRVAEEKRFRFETEEFYLKSFDEMWKLFGDIPESITNTRLVAEMCDLEMPERKYRLPRFACPDGKTEAQHMEDLVWQGVRRLYGSRADTDPVLRERVEFEIATIVRMGFPSYFLIVSDFIAYARSVGIPVGPGRGSAAGSVVAYALGITQLEPLEHGLLFERFLNPDRLSMPDIDIDFCYERRGEVIDYVRKKYGEECVAQIITFGTMKAKAAVRDIGRVMDLPLPLVDRVAKAIPNDLKMTIAKARAESPQLQELMQGDQQVARLVESAEKIEGMVRHASTHAAGIIISDRDITDYCPLYKAAGEERPATQFDMNACEEELGLLKMDFLGLKNLTIIQRVEKWVEEREGVVLDWDKIPLDDPKTYEILGQGQTLGVFQLESPGMTTLVKKLKPTEFADLTALLALYRPGPLGANMHEMYVRRKHGREKVEYDHEVVKPILEETYGVILYQEQVMRIAMAMSGFSRGEADKLRKAMGKKKREVMEPLREKWVEGAPKASGVSKELAAKIWDDVLNFASYGFNKSHSAAYAVITFRTAYLRAHYRTYLLAATLTNEIDGTSDGIAKYIGSCREAGVRVLPPDINRSRPYFNPDGAQIWYALNGIKGVGTDFARAIVEERDANGPFSSLQDFCLRLPKRVLNSRQVEALIRVGAFDCMGFRRSSMLAALPRILGIAGEVARSRESGFVDLFAGDGEAEAELVQEVVLEDLPDWDDRERAAAEKEHLGFYLSEHPLKRYEAELTSFGNMPSSAIEEFVEREVRKDKRDRPPLRLMGCVVSIQQRVDKNGKQWAIVGMEDMHGPFEVKFFAYSFADCADHLVPDAVLQVEATASIWNDRISIDGRHVRPAAVLRDCARGVEIEWMAEQVDDAALFQLKEACQRHRGSRAVVIAVRHGESLLVEFGLNGASRIALTDAAMEDLRNLPGQPRLRFLGEPPPIPRRDRDDRAPAPSAPSSGGSLSPFTMGN